MSTCQALYINNFFRSLQWWYETDFHVFKLGLAYGKIVTWMIFIFRTPWPFPEEFIIQDLWLFFPLPKLSSSHPKPGGVSINGINWSHDLSTVWETWVPSLGWEDLLEKEMAIHSSTIAWKIPWTEEPGRLQSMGSQRVGHDWATSLSYDMLKRVPDGLPVTCAHVQ